MSFNLVVDRTRCSGCQACIVACMDQNDLFPEKKEDSWRQVFQVESGSFPEAKIAYISQACKHCQEAQCLSVCPTDAIYKDDDTGIVRVREDLCNGCHSCSQACPYDVPRFGEDGKMQKCQMCAERIEHGLEPACVHTCPTKALRLEEVND